MKKLFIGFLLSLLVSTAAYAGTVLIDEATSTGAGKPLAVRGAKNHTVVATFTNASTMVISLDASIDNTTWPSIGDYTIDATDISNGYAIFHVNDRLVEYVKPNITTLTGGGATVTVTISSK